MEIGNIKPDITQILKEQVSIPSAKGENAQADSTAALPVNIQEAQSTVEALKELLVSYGLNVGKENIDIMQKLLENAMPSDKESVLKLNQALKLFNMLDTGENTAENKALHLEKAVFALKNQLPVNSETVYKMDGFLNGGKSISSNIDSIMQELGKLEESPVKDEILRIFIGEETIIAEEKSAPAESLATPTHDTPIPKTAASNISEQSSSPANLASKGESFVEPSATQTATPKENPNLPTAELTSPQKQIIENLIKEFTAGPKKMDLDSFFSKLDNISEKGRPITKEQALKFIEENFKNNSEIIRTFTDVIEKKNAENNPSSTVESTFHKFRLNPRENDIEKLEQTLNELKQKTDEALKLAENMNAKLPDSLTKALKNLNNNMEFINQLKTCIYIPIPLNAPTGQVEGELYVFKDKRSKNKTGATSALIGLNTVNLGRVETYIQKQENRLSLQFRLENMDTNKLLVNHAEILTNLLEGAGLKLTAMSVMPLDTAFDILKKEPSAKETGYELNSKAFDTRA